MAQPERLILFDIDATLLTTDGAGMRAMGSAGRLMFGPGFSATDVDYAGRLDPLIIADLMRVNAVSATPARLDEFRRLYIQELGRLLTDAVRGRALPGVPTLIGGLVDRVSTALGLLTGNFEEGGMLKLAASGIDPSPFIIRVWGDSPWRAGGSRATAVPTRNDLPPVAHIEYQRIFGAPIAATSITIIGDTPHDVQCAKVNGCRSLAVATGRYSYEELTAVGADRVVHDLSRDADLLDWLLLG